MFDSFYEADQIGNVRDGARCCYFAHNSVLEADVPPVLNNRTGVMPIRAWRPHVGGGTPGVICWRDAEFRVIAIAGAREPADQQQTIAGWNNPVTMTGFQGLYNYNASRWATSLATFLATELSAIALPTYWYAYSWGGAPAAILVKVQQRSFVGSRAWAVTFGTPKFADFNGNQELRGTTLSRIFLRNDPICFLPFTTEQAPWATTAIASGSLQTWDRWRYGENGFGMSPTAAFTAMYGPDQVPLPIEQNIEEYVRLNVGEGRPHSIATYVNILETYYPTTNDLATDPDTTPGHSAGVSLSIEPRGDVLTKRSLQRSARSVVHTRSSTVPSNVAAAARRRNRKLIRVMKENGMYSVFIVQDRVYMATSKRDARGVANALRAMAIQLGQQPNLWTTDEVVAILRRNMDLVQP